MTVRFLFVVVLGAVLLSGCAQYEGIKIAARTAGEKAADETLDYAIFVKCRLATIGAIQRRYRGRLEVWAAECFDYIPSSM